jgi:hypothetical protein
MRHVWKEGVRSKWFKANIEHFIPNPPVWFESTIDNSVLFECPVIYHNYMLSLRRFFVPIVLNHSNFHYRIASKTKIPRCSIMLFKYQSDTTSRVGLSWGKKLFFTGIEWKCTDFLGWGETREKVEHKKELIILYQIFLLSYNNMPRDFICLSCSQPTKKVVQLSTIQ